MKAQLGLQEWLSMESAGYRPRPRSVLLLLAAPEPCALAFMTAASSCTRQDGTIRTLPVMSDVSSLQA